MSQWMIHGLAIVAAVAAACGVGYYLLCILGAISLLRSRRDFAVASTPPVSILKPLRGTDPDIYESFRSHCLQDYPEYEIIFGVSDPADPVVPLVEQLQREFPQRQIQLVVCPRALGSNLKVSNLVQMLPHAHHSHLIINDSDIRVPSDYLRQVIAPLSDPKTGMVTCLYRGIAGSTLGSKLESLGTSTDFAAGALAARQLEGIRFGLGSTLSFRRSELDAIGGLEPLLDYLADDFELGARVAAAGFEVQLSHAIVDHHLPDYTFSSFIQHQLRWGRSTRHSRPGGYAGVVLTYGVPWAMLAVLLQPAAAWTWILLGITLGVRLIMAWMVAGKVLHDRQFPRLLWLLPLRDWIGLLIWLGSFTGRTVSWRGHGFVLEKGKLRPIH